MSQDFSRTARRLRLTVDVRADASLTRTTARPSSWSLTAAGAGLALVIAAACGAAPFQTPPAAPPAEGAASPQSTADAQADAAQAELDTEEALARYQQLLQRRPFHGPAFTSLVTHYVEREKLDQLVKEYEAKSAALPDEVALRIILARLYLRSGNAEKAAELAATIETLPPALARLSSELLVFKSEVFQRIGDMEGAERMLTTALAQAASVSEELRLGEALADLRLARQERDAAIETLRSLAAKYPDQYVHQRHIADALAQRGLHEAAVAQYRTTLALVVDEVDKRCETLRQLGLSLERLELRDEAIAAYSEAVGLLASDHWLQRELHERIVTLYRASNRLEDLAIYCREQIAKAPEQTAMRVLLADVQMALGRGDEAKATLEEAVTLFPADVTLSQRRLELLERAGDVEGSLAEHQRIIAKHPDDAELYIVYGQFLAANKQVDAARNQWAFVLEKHVADAGLANRLGILFETNELFEDAVQAYERAIALAPAQPDAYLALSRLWALRGDRDKAVAALERAAAANPTDGTVHAAVASGLLGMGQGERALAAMQRACELSPTQVRYRQTLADLLILAGRLEDALAVRREAIDLMTNPVQQAEAIAILVSMHASADRLPQLEEAEKKRLETAPNDPTALLLLAGAADARRDFVAQRTWLDAILAVAPGNEVALRSLARLQDATADVDAAVATWKRIVELHPQRARPAYDAIVDLKLRYGDKAGAIETLEEMVAADPGNVAVLNGVAEQLQRMGDPERALSYYEESLKLQPDRHETRLEYGKALADAGRLEDALAAYRRVATQRGDTDSAIDAMSRLHDTATQLGSLEELIDDLQHEVEIDPSNTLAARALAQILIREFEYTRAMELLDVVQRNNPRDVDLALGRAELLRRLAQFDKAIEAYQVVLRQPQIDRDFVLGEIGKAHFESGQLDQAKRLWRQIQNRLYAGSLLKNNGMLDEAIAVFEEGIRLKPDDYGLHRSLIGALEAAGRTQDALMATRRLLDLEPDNANNIIRLAEAHLKLGDRAGAAEVAARLFSANVLEKKTGTSPNSQQYARRSYYYYGMGSGNARSSLERGVGFFLENGMLAELGDALDAQVAAQPDNAVLKMRTADLYAYQLSKPEKSLALLKELETAEFPVEHQTWLGQCTQRDWMRLRQYMSIAQMPALRDAALVRLGAKKAEDLAIDEVLELAVIRNAQGDTEEAIRLLSTVVSKPEIGSLARGALIDMLLASERYADAEPLALQQVEALSAEREKMHAQTVERVRRDFVRTLPIEWQLRMSEELIEDIARKRTLGTAFLGWSQGSVSTMGYLRARLSLATIYAKTGRMEEAREIWKSLAPTRTPDLDAWTMLGSVAQLHDQEDLAYEFYRQGMAAARSLAKDPLLRRVFASSIAGGWYSEEQAVDASFNKIVAAFAERDGLIELYDYLRDTDQTGHAQRIAEQYSLDEKLEPLFAERVAQAAEAFRAEKGQDAFERSIGYFAAVCKLAEVHERRGAWDKALAVYQDYLKDFPDELQLLETLGMVAEAELDLDAAIEWEKRVLDTKTRLSRRSRQWNSRDLTLTPAMPKALSQSMGNEPWMWQSRWRGGSYGYGYGYGGMGGPGLFDRSESWMRLAQLYLANDNPLAAGDAMSRAVADAGNTRDEVVERVLALIQERQLAGSMLPVLRSLAVYAPGEEKVQLAFAESLEANQRTDLAVEVCQRMLRRGVTDLGVLAQVRSRLQALAPETAPPKATLASLEAEVAADPTNLKGRLQLGKAYYYSLDLEKALTVLDALAAEAPHLEDVHPLIVEIHTLRHDTDRLIAALKTQIDRTSDEAQRRSVQWRLVEEYLAAGRNDEAMTLVQGLGDPRDPNSYPRIAALLHYFGRHDEALKQLDEGKKSQMSARYYGRNQDFSHVSALLKGDVNGAIDKILASIDEQARQQVQYGGMGMYGQEGLFSGLGTLFVLEPTLATELTKRLEERRAASPDDPQPAKLLMDLHRTLGRPDLADAILETLVEKKSADRELVSSLIDRAVRKRDFQRAVTMAQEFIAAQPKPKLDPGVPTQYAGQMALQSPYSFMSCKLGDVYWDMGEKDKAFESYRNLIVDRVDDTRIAYATICLTRGRAEEAKVIIDEALAAQQVKSPTLLKFRALIAAVEDDMPMVYEMLAAAAVAPVDQSDAAMYGYMDESQSPMPMLVDFVVAQHARGQGDEMVSKLEALLKDRIAKTPADWANYASLVRLHERLGAVDAALAVINEASAVPSLSQNAMSERLRLEAAYAPVETVVGLYRQAIELADRAAGGSSSAAMYSGMVSDRGEPRQALGELLWEAGDREGARAAWTERRNLKQPHTQVWLGSLYLQLGDKETAEKHFRAALALDPEFIEAHMALADLSARKGQFGEAYEHMLVSFLRKQNSAASRGADRSRGGWWYSGLIDDPRMHEWALAIAREGGATEASEDDVATGDRGQGRIMLALLTGDWSGLESALRERIDAGTFDPMIWKLWAHAQQRRGNWEEAARALDYLRRARSTSIADHRAQLEITLAGKQLKEASAGTRQANQTNQPMPNQQMGSMPYPGYMDNYWGGTDASTAELAAINVRLGRFVDAERLYLLSSGRSSVAATLPAIANLLWDQNAHDRALELMRLSLLLADSRYGSGNSYVQLYAVMLAENGKVDEAVDLLVRAYRMSGSDNDDYGMYGYVYPMQDQQLEQGYESSLAAALYSVLVRTGRLDQTLASMTAAVAADPTDRRLGKLLLGLNNRAGRWSDQKAALAAWRAARPDDLPLQLEELHACEQLGQWDEARALLETIRKGSPKYASQWGVHQAFIDLMTGQPDKAVEAIEPLIADPSVLDEQGNGGVSPQAVRAILVCANRPDRLASFLETQRDRKGGLDSDAAGSLVRSYEALGRLDDALRVAAEQFWRSTDVLSPSDPWFRAIARIGLRAAETGVQVTTGPGRPQDAALVTLATQGPEAGRAAFAALEDSLDARRGALLAAAVALDGDAMLEANGRVIEWLESRRRQTWYWPPLPRISDGVRQSLKETGANGATVVAFGQSRSLASGITGVLSGTDPVSFDEAWRSYQAFQRDLLARQGKVEELRALIRDQRRRMAGVGRSNQGARTYGYDPRAQQDQSDQAMLRDPTTLVRSLLWRNARFSDLLTEYDVADRDLPSTEWAQAGAVAAAAGRGDVADAKRRAAAELAVATMVAGDVPSLTQGTASMYRWYWYGGSGQEVEQIRTALRSESVDALPDDPDRVPAPFLGTPTEPWQLAFVDPHVAAALEACEKEIGPGWEATRTLNNLIRYYDRKGEPQRVIALIERVYGQRSNLRSELLAEYLRACFQAGDYERIETVLAQALDVSSSLANQVAVLRLVSLRKQGKTAEADEMERTLLSRCEVETPNPARPAPDLEGELAPQGATATRQEGSSVQRVFRSGRWYYMPDSSRSLVSLSTAPMLASSLGVRFQPTVSMDDPTAEAVTMGYASHGLYRDAARVAATRMAVVADDRERLALQWEILQYLRRAGDEQALRAAASEYERALAEAAKASPRSPRLQYLLAEFYRSSAGGRDFGKALAALQKARKLDPGYDPGGLQAVECLYRSGRYEEAWAEYDRLLAHGNGDVLRVPTLYFAGLSAKEAGNRKAALPLLRLAAFQYPAHALASRVHDLTAEDSHDSTH